MSFVITTAEFLRIAALIFGLAAALLFIRAFSGARRAQRAAYYSTRREARRIAFRYLSVSLASVIIAGSIFVVSFFLPSQTPSASLPAAVIAVTVTPIAQPTVYIVPTTTPTVSPGTPIPLPTPTQRVSISLTHLISPTRTPITNDKYLSLHAISNAIDAQGQPISATAEFTRGVPTVYIFFDYNDAPQGALVHQTWFLNGGSVHFDSTTWNRAGDGTTYISWSPARGFDSGLYEVRVLLGDTRQFSANFMVH
jgi:hypothetical protein